MAAVNRNLLVTFLDVLQTDAIEESFSPDSFNIRLFYKLVKERHILETSRIVSLSTEKDARHASNNPSHKPVGILAHCQDSPMKEMGTDQVVRLYGVLWRSLATK